MNACLSVPVSTLSGCPFVQMHAWPYPATFGLACLSACVTVCLDACLPVPVCLSVCMHASAYLATVPPACLSACVAICLNACLCAWLSAC